MRHLLHTRILICSITALLLGSTSMLSAQSLTSDQPDYPPGSVATFFGMGFAPYDTVTLHVEHVNMMADDSATYDSSQYIPWTVVADSMGDFTTQWVVCSCDGDTLMAVATGTSGSTANVVFTDAALTVYNNVSISTPVTNLSFVQGSGSNVIFNFNVVTLAPNEGFPVNFEITNVRRNGSTGGNPRNNLGFYFSPDSINCTSNLAQNFQCSLNFTSASQTGTYVFQIRGFKSNPNGREVFSSDLTLNVCSSPSISSQPLGGAVCLNNPDTLSVTATSSSPLSYQWRKNGTNISGATSRILIIPNAQVSDNGSYDVIVT
ncbi:MAG: immunoglobulin domain-containing protein, partial [Bacteroidota bacterium]